MKFIPLIFVLLFFSNIIKGQDLKSELIELSMSNPQPRLNDYSIFSLNIQLIRRLILASIPQAQIKDYIKIHSDKYDILSKKMDKKGNFELGPFNISLNGINCKSNVLHYEVIDTLPLTDEGLWIRSVKQSDSTFCIIVEQNIPTDSIKLQLYKSQLRNKVNADYITLFGRLGFDTIDAIRYKSASNQREFSSVYISGVKQMFEHSRYMYFMEITEKHTSIVLKEKDFINLPPNYKFKDIIIQ